MKKILGLAVLLFALSSVAFGQGSTYQTKLSTMMKAQGAEATFKVSIKGMLEQMKSLRSDIPGEVWAEMESEFEKASIDELIEMLVPVYEKYLTEEDLDGIIEFYNSPVGKKLATVTPNITQESMLVGQQWGMKIGEIVGERLKEKGY